MISCEEITLKDGLRGSSSESSQVAVVECTMCFPSTRFPVCSRVLQFIVNGVLVGDLSLGHNILFKVRSQGLD